MKCVPTKEMTSADFEQLSNSEHQNSVAHTGWCRKIVLTKLKNLRSGRLVVSDGDGQITVGDNSDKAIQVSIRVFDGTFYRDILFGGNLGVAEAYLQGKWDCDDLPGLIRIFCRNMSETSAMNRGIAKLVMGVARVAHRLASNSVSGSRRNIAAHYDLSNKFFQLFLDPTMMYSSAYYTHPEMSLEQASIAKLDRICRKLELKPTDHLLEIGTGWGGLAIHAAKNFGCRVTTTTISKQQYDLAMQRVEETGLSNQIELLLEDYRHLQGQYDKVGSIEMIEAVGHEFLPTYFQQCNNLLKPGGRFLVQAITIPDQRYDVYRKSVDFIQKYIFPGGHLPSIGAMQDATRKNTNLRLQSIEDFGHSYALTLREWRKRFFEQIDEVRKLGFDDRFIRMWDYYFSYCEGAFLEQAVGVSQLVWNKAEY